MLDSWLTTDGTASTSWYHSRTAFALQLGALNTGTMFTITRAITNTSIIDFHIVAVGMTRASIYVSIHATHRARLDAFSLHLKKYGYLENYLIN